MDPQLLVPALIFLPAALGFIGCFLPRIIFPFSIAMLLAYAGISLGLIGTDTVFAFTLVAEGGIQFSVDAYTFPLVFGSSITYPPITRLLCHIQHYGHHSGALLH